MIPIMDGIDIIYSSSKEPKQLSRARNIAATLGTRSAAGFLRNRGWSLETSLWVLARASLREWN